MKDRLIDIGYLLAALALLALEALFRLVIGLPYRLWEKWRYEAQCLRYPGGGWGHSMKEGARAKAKKSSQDKSRRSDRL